MLNKISCGHCIELIQQIDSSSVDMILCDLPYGITAPQWDQPVDLSELWQAYQRIIKPTGTIALFATQPFTTSLINSNLSNFRYCWYWLKNQGTNFFHAKRMPIRRVEEICIFGKGKYIPQMSNGHVPTSSARGQSLGKAYHGINTRNYDGGETSRYPTNILEFPCVSNYDRLHSSQKPVELCEYLIKTYTDLNEIVLDNCIGSGTTAIACLNTDRQFIGIDIDPKSCEIAQERIDKF